MSQDNLPQHDDDMLEAIKAAFGDDAINILDNNEIDDQVVADDKAVDGQDLDELVQQIDSATVSTSETDSTDTTRQSEEAICKTIVFELNDLVLGIPMVNVHEIQRLPKITFLPNVPEWVLGVANLRGQIVSVVDLGQLLDLKSTERTPSVSRRLVMTHSVIDEVDTGLVVDRVWGIRNLPERKIKPPTSPMNEGLNRFLSGVIEFEGNLIAMLDIEKLLLSEDFRQFDAA